MTMNLFSKIAVLFLFHQVRLSYQLSEEEDILSFLLEKVPTIRKFQDDYLTSDLSEAISVADQQRELGAYLSFEETCTRLEESMAKFPDQVQCSCNHDTTTMTCQINGSALQECNNSMAYTELTRLCAGTFIIETQFFQDRQGDWPLLQNVDTFKVCMHYDHSVMQDHEVYRDGCATFEYPRSEKLTSVSPDTCKVEFVGDEALIDAMRNDLGDTRPDLIECNSCHVCGHYGFNVNCTNIQSDAMTEGTDGCEYWHSPERDFFLNFHIRTTIGSSGNDTKVITGIEIPELIAPPSDRARSSTSDARSNYYILGLGLSGAILFIIS